METWIWTPRQGVGEAAFAGVEIVVEVRHRIRQLQHDLVHGIRSQGPVSTRRQSRKLLRVASAQEMPLYGSRKGVLERPVFSQIQLAIDGIASLRRDLTRSQLEAGPRARRLLMWEVE